MEKEEIEKPTFSICDGCEEYSTCMGGIHEDCELGYDDMLQNSDTAFIMVKDSDDDKSYESDCDEKVFHLIDRSDDLYAIRETSKFLKEERGQENMIVRRHGQYELFTYPVIGHGESARFGRNNNG